MGRENTKTNYFCICSLVVQWLPVGPLKKIGVTGQGELRAQSTRGHKSKETEDIEHIQDVAIGTPRKIAAIGPPRKIYKHAQICIFPVHGNWLDIESVETKNVCFVSNCSRARKDHRTYVPV